MCAMLLLEALHHAGEAGVEFVAEEALIGDRAAEVVVGGAGVECGDVAAAGASQLGKEVVKQIELVALADALAAGVLQKGIDAALQCRARIV